MTLFLSLVSLGFLENFLWNTSLLNLGNGSLRSQLAETSAAGTTSSLQTRTVAILCTVVSFVPKIVHSSGERPCEHLSSDK